MGSSSSKHKAAPAPAPDPAHPAPDPDLVAKPPPAVVDADPHVAAVSAVAAAERPPDTHQPDPAAAAPPAAGTPAAADTPPVATPGTKQVEVLRVNNPHADDATNQTGQSHYELKIQDSFYSTPHRPRSKAYTDAVEAAKARKAAKAERRADRATKKKAKHAAAAAAADDAHLVPNTVPWAIHNTKKLGILNLSRMRLQHMPDLVFDSLPGTARIINVSDNRLAHLDTRLCDYVLVQRLIANDNLLASIPHAISRMTALKKLDLARNRLTALPDAFDAMLHLEHVDLADNLLDHLPPSFASLNLTVLNLSHNKFSLAPLEIASMHLLLELNMNANQLTALPDEYSALNQLIALHLDENRITHFPDAILQTCVHLVTLRLKANPITMSDLEASQSYAQFSERRRIKLKRQLHAGQITPQDLFPADS